MPGASRKDYVVRLAKRILDKPWISEGFSCAEALYSGGMKSSLITALTIVGVLGTAAAAMAVNADTLSGANQGTIGNAVEVLVPVVSENELTTPFSSPTPSVPSATPVESEPMPDNVAPSPRVQAPISSDSSRPDTNTDSSNDESDDASEDDESDDD